MTNNELIDLKKSIIKTRKIKTAREAIIVFIFLVAIITLPLLLIENISEDFIAVPIVISSLIFTLFLVRAIYLYNKDKEKFSSIKLNEYKNRLSINDGYYLNVYNLKEEKSIKKKVIESINKADIARGNPRLYSVLDISSDNSIITRSEFDIVSNNGQSSSVTFSGYMYSFVSGKSKYQNLRVSNKYISSRYFKKINNDGISVCYNKKIIKDSNEIDSTAIKEIEDIYNNWTSCISKEDLNKKKYGVSVVDSVTYLFISKDKKERFSKLYDFTNDYNNLESQINKVYEILYQSKNVF